MSGIICAALMATDNYEYLPKEDLNPDAETPNQAHPPDGSLSSFSKRPLCAHHVPSAGLATGG